jgi:hypothetical protein
MPGYIKDVLHKFQHPMPKRPQYAPHIWTVPVYGQRIQYAPLPDDPPPPATAQEITRAQAIVGTLLYNDRAVYPTIWPRSFPQPQQQPSMLSHISLTTAVLTHKPPSDTLHLTCNLRFTVMPLTSISPRLSQELAVIYTWVTRHTNPRNPSPMVHFCAICKRRHCHAHTTG